VRIFPSGSESLGPGCGCPDRPAWLRLGDHEVGLRYGVTFELQLRSEPREGEKGADDLLSTGWVKTWGLYTGELEFRDPEKWGRMHLYNL
jgi:hypothetical protein